MTQRAATFQESMQLTAELLSACTQNSQDSAHSRNAASEHAKAEIEKLLSSRDGARGFFVTFLTGDYALADHPPLWLRQAFLQQAETVFELLVKNLVMSTCTKLSHERGAHAHEAAGSEKVRARVHKIIVELADPQLQRQCLEMKEAIADLLDSKSDNSANSCHNFLTKWKYDAPQLEAAKQALEGVCS